MGKRLLECPQAGWEPGIVGHVDGCGARGRLWGAAGSGPGGSAGRLVSLDHAPTVNMKRGLEKHMPRQLPSLWRGRLPLSRPVGEALFAHLLGLTPPAGPSSPQSLDPALNRALASVCLLSARTLSQSHCLPPPLLRLSQTRCQAQSLCLPALDGTALDLAPGGSGVCRVLFWFSVRAAWEERGLISGPPLAAVP